VAAEALFEIDWTTLDLDVIDQNFPVHDRLPDGPVPADVLVAVEPHGLRETLADTLDLIRDWLSW
jgi:hypothetical protein